MSAFWWCSALALLLPAYAEIHYRLPGLPSRLFRREPEMLFDLPFRVDPGRPIPLFLLVKDAHRFPVHLKEATVQLTHPESGEQIRFTFPLNREVRDPLWHRVLLLKREKLPRSGDYTVWAWLEYRIGGRRRRLMQDNYPGRRKPPFHLHLGEDALPAGSGWLWGDLHTHSSYTRDQLEFGAPPELLARNAEALGLRFVAVTDHSYDLEPPSSEPFPPPDLQAPWAAFQKEMDEWAARQSGVVLLRGEEVSAGNREGRNVHALMLGNRTLYPGRGDGGRHFWRNRPTLDLPRLHQRRREDDPRALLFAAHPLSRPPRSQQWVLNRGHWTGKDLDQQGIQGWQLLNGPLDQAFWEGLTLWKKALLKGKQIVLIGGSDAHGNFNLFRQITLPLLQLVCKPVHRLGEARTGLRLLTPPSESALLEALRQGRAIVSNGPFLSLHLASKERSVHIGETAPTVNNPDLCIQAISSREFGTLSQLWLRIGLLAAGYELSLPIPLQPNTYRLEQKRAVALPQGKAYIRGELVTRKGEQLFYCFTNPIWIGL
ncbi:MAG: hypothetical protein D6715_07485 [Calditrichaeota bacterium]|nr:MAG: hypothetical protein D6715_07485 [Calditrichota bacterium]